MSAFFSLLAMALFIEGIISYGQTIYKNKSIQWQIVVALILSAIFCYDTDSNFFTAIGLTEKYPIIGLLATAVSISRGSNYMFEMYQQLVTWRRNQENNE